MKVYVYDFDGTIYDGDSTVDFLLFLINKQKRLILKVPTFIIYFIKYKTKQITKEKFKESVYSIFNNFNNTDELIKEFWRKKEYKIKTFFKDKTNHKNDIIASASPYFLLEPIAQKYQIKQLFASPVDKKTGKYQGKNCYGIEKVNCITKKYPDCKICEMYSDDAKADKPLLELAETSYIINKNKITKYTKQAK